MERTPPPLFRTGPSALTRLIIFVTLSIALLVADARFNYLSLIRQVSSVAVYPLQQLATTPKQVWTYFSDLFISQTSLRKNNLYLSAQNLILANAAQEAEALRIENVHLRALVDAREKSPIPSVVAEILYAARDPFSRKVMIDKGLQQDIVAGRPVVDHLGVIGQISQTYPWLSEVTLITDKGHLVPVLNVRTGARAVIAGTGDDSRLELRFVPLASDFQKGDRLVTSGIDGIYPQGIPVAEVMNVERNSAALFATVDCKPLAGVNTDIQVLVLGPLPSVPERPTTPTPSNPKKKKGGA
jgi:rod shape-determining protein MreC